MKTSLFLLLLSLPLLCPGQVIPSGEPEISTPDVWSFMKYGGGTPTLYTGTVKVDIPIYTYKDKDFEIPVTVSYASNGFIANMHSGSLGLGWFLNAGGCITREVVGKPDDQSYSGFYSYYKLANKPNLNKPIIERGYHDGIIDMFLLEGNPNGSWETESDIYSFNFPGHSGKFMLGQDGIRVFNASNPQGEYRIDMSKFIASHAMNQERSSEITITTGDGYQYTFGIPYKHPYINGVMRIDDVVVSDFINTSPNPSGGTREYVQKTWMLREIKSPNGRTVTFEYSDPAMVESVRFSGRYEEHQWKQISAGFWYPGSKGYSNSGPFGNNFRVQKYGIAAVQLTKITVDYSTLNIDFTYREREKKEAWKHLWSWGTEYVTQDLQGLPQLDTITVKRPHYPSPQIIRKCELSYGYPNASGNNALMLKSLSIIGEGTYSMDYYNETSAFPFHGTAAFDHWGYYNLYNSNSDELYNGITYLVPKATIDQNFREVFNESFKEPTFEGSLYGMLKMLSFPTGGYSSYEYQPHDYSKKVYKDYTSQNKPSLRSCNKTIAGGVRIRRITDYAQANEKGYSREFIYNKSESNTSFSSGHLLHTPRYWFQAELKLGLQTNWRAILSITDLQAFSKDGYHIEYGKVYEKFGDGSYIEHNFSNYATIPDQLDIQAQRVPIIGGSIPGYIINQPQYAYNYLAAPLSLSSQRGKVTSRVFYDASKKKQKAERYRYDANKSLDYLEAVKTFYWGFNTVYVHKTFVDDYPLESTSEMLYFGNDSLRKETQFVYNGLGQLVKSTSTDEKNNITIEQIQYIHDLPSRESIHNTMLAKNVVKYPVKAQTKIKRYGIDSDFKLLKGSRNEYANPTGNLIVLTQQRQTELGAPITVPDFDFDSQLKTFSQYTYDNKGNLTQYRGRDGVPTTYLWGYNDQYPMAKVVNACLESAISGYDDVYFQNFESLDHYNVFFGFHSYRSRAGVFTVNLNSNPNRRYIIDYQFFRDGVWKYKNDKFENGSYTIDEGNHPIDDVRVFPTDALITSFNYIPLVGMTSRTDEKGITESYGYYPFGKLGAIADTERNTLQEFYYNFANHSSLPEDYTLYYNETVVRSFTRNNCDSSKGEIGEPVLYMVPSRTFLSSISQEDADRKAYDYLLQTGQQYANKNGRCITPH